MDYTEHYGPMARTPQTNSIPGTEENNAGGYAFPVDDWTRLDRFLILGAEGGTCYVGEKRLTRTNAEACARLIDDPSTGPEAVDRIVEISRSGRAPSNDPALFLLAMACASAQSEVRARALRALPKVARIGTHLFHFAHFVEAFRGWGRGLRQAVRHWYKDKSPEDLAHQLMKYRQRKGWSHGDLLRLSHPVPPTESHRVLFASVLGKPLGGEALHKLPSRYARAQSLDGLTEDAVAEAVRAERLPREVVPSDHLNSPEVWRALLEAMPVGALIRNLGKLTQVGVLDDLNREAVDLVTERVTDPDTLKRARVHPLQVLLALKTYALGGGFRGKLNWQPVRRVLDALDTAFYRAFGSAEPTNQRVLIGLDVSGSMNSPIQDTNLSCREGAAALSLVTAATEPYVKVTAFSSARQATWRPSKVGSHTGFGPPIGGLAEFPISPRERLDDVVRRTERLDFGGTDCALPMLYAMDQELEVDAFFVYTDSETWAGEVHPMEALRQYRSKMKINAKLVVVGMTSDGFSIADPNDGGSLDVVGFDSSVPNIMVDFLAQWPNNASSTWVK